MCFAYIITFERYLDDYLEDLSYTSFSGQDGIDIRWYFHKVRQTYFIISIKFICLYV